MLTAEGAESAEVFIGKHKTRLIGFSIRNVFSVYSVASAVKSSFVFTAEGAESAEVFIGKHKL